MLSINIQTPSSVMQELKERFKQARLSFELTQVGLSRKSGVSLGSIKRFESSSEISLKSLLKLAVILECLDDFRSIAIPKSPTVSSLDQLIKNNTKSITAKRGKIK